MISLIKERKSRKNTETFLATSERYKVLKKLGEGSYGVAYLLFDKNTEQNVVLKRLKGKHLHLAGYEKFQQEISFLKKLQQFAVPKVLTDGMIGESPFYMMTYADGVTFEQAIFLQNRIFTIEETIYFTNKLLLIIQQIHLNGIVHRDLRIPNILLKDDELTIIDFGLASNIDWHTNTANIEDPKKIPHPISDLYAIGHFMLFLLYSSFEPTTKKGTTWQQELALPSPLQRFIERLLTINEPFTSCTEAIAELRQLQKEI